MKRLLVHLGELQRGRSRGLPQTPWRADCPCSPGPHPLLTSPLPLPVLTECFQAAWLPGALVFPRWLLRSPSLSAPGSAVSAVTLVIWIMGCYEACWRPSISAYLRAHWAVFPLKPTAEVNLSPSSSHGLELKCHPTFSPREIEIYGPLSISTHASHYLKVPLFLGADRYLL